MQGIRTTMEGLWRALGCAHGKEEAPGKNE